MDTKALRQKILDLAIRGKLVPQDPNDEPASVLLERIRAQKQQMVKEGKLKAKDIKNDTIIFKGEDNLHYEKFQDGTVKCIEDEIPFEIPEGWTWCRLGNIVTVLGGKRIPAGRKLTPENTGHIYIRVSDMHDGTVYKNNLQFVPTDIYPKIKQYIINKEDVYITVAGTIGRVGKVPPELDGANLTENADRLVFQLIDQDWLINILQSELLQKKIEFFTTQVGQPKLAIANIQKFIIPLPPQKEQAKISECIQRLKKSLSSIDEEVSNIRDSIDATKSRILDLAIRGKLVPQDPNDEPASVLLERIRAEKEELVKQGKIKRDKKESVIFKGEDNSYYEDVPANWEEVSLLSIAEVELGKTLDSAKNTGEFHPYLRSVNIKWSSTDLTDLKSMRFEPEEYDRYTVSKGDLLICEGGDVGRCCIWDKNEPIFYQNALHRVRFYGKCNSKFFLFYLIYLESIGYLKRISNGVTIKHLTKNVLASIPFLLPPLAEQQRIVAAIETYFALLDQIAESLS